MIPDVEPGLYKHFKGHVYVVLFTAFDVDKDCWVVVYHRGEDYYTRSMESWYDIVDAVDSDTTERLTRFVKID